MSPPEHRPPPRDDDVVVSAACGCRAAVSGSRVTLAATLADTLADLEHRPAQAWLPGPARGITTPSVRWLRCCRAGHQPGAAVMGTSGQSSGGVASCFPTSVDHCWLQNSPLLSPATSRHHPLSFGSPPHCCCVNCNWSSRSQSPPFQAPAAELENI